MDYTKHSALTSQNLLGDLVGRYLDANPGLRLGETMDGPQMVVLKGKQFSLQQHLQGMSADAIDMLDPPPPDDLPAYKTAVIGRAKVYFKDFNKLEAFHLKLDDACKEHFLHPYAATIPYLDMLKHKVGDVIHVSSSEPETYSRGFATVTVTQEILDKHAFVYVSLAISS